MPDLTKMSETKPYSNATLYAQMLEPLKTAARSCGYALAIHGSMVNDLDLVAVAWTDDAGTPEDLVKVLLKACGGWCPESGRVDDNWTALDWKAMPGGRRCVNICFGGRVFIDLNVCDTRRMEVPKGHVKLDDGRVYEIIKWAENTDRPIYGTAIMLGEIVVVARPAALAAKGVER